VAFKTSTKAIYQGARADGEPYGLSDAPWNTQTYDLWTQHAGRAPTILHWGQPFGALDTNALNIAKTRGAVSLISVDFPVDSINSGSLDATIDAFAAKCKAWGYPILLRPGWEMNGTWFGWGRKSGFVAAWRRYVSRIRAIAPNVSFVWCPNTIWDSASDPAPYFPGEAYVDWVGIDGYNRAEPWHSPYEVFKATYDRLRLLAPNRPMMICETGCVENGGNKAAWLTNLLTKALPERFPAVKALIWFNWNIFEKNRTWEWPIESSSASQAAYKAGLALPYYSAVPNFTLGAKLRVPA